MKMETWKDIPEYEGLYKASSHGSIISLDRISYNFRGQLKLKGKKLKGSLSKTGYKNVFLSKEGVVSCFSIHRLIAELFIPNPYNKDEVNHINGIKTDNRVDNLEWATGSENIKHAFNKGLRIEMKGVKNGRSKLTESDIISIRKNYIGLTFEEISKKYPVSAQAISDIINRKKWKHVD